MTTRAPAFTVAERDRPYRSSYPLDFRLRDDQGEPVMSIARDASGLTLNLEIANMADTPIELIKPDGTPKVASPDSYHFELRFRPGVLSAATLALEARQVGDWLISAPASLGAYAGVSFYLLHTGGRVLQRNERISLLLPSMSASGGTRGTPVELGYTRLLFADGTPIEGQSLFHLHLVNRGAPQQSPLRVGIVSPNHILNDAATANSVRLKITNIMTSDLGLIDQDGRSAQFILSFDSSTSDLGTTDGGDGVATLSQVKEFEVNVAHPKATPKDHSDWRVEQGNLGNEPVWTITPSGTTPIPAGDSFYIDITNIRSSATTGQANLYLRYEDIPGYGNAQFICTVEKGPLISTSNRRVGVGTANPVTALQVKGALTTDTLAVTGTASNANSGSVVIGSTGASNLRLGFDTDYSWLQSHGAKPLAINSVGNNVGIGTTSPSAKLEVTGSGGLNVDFVVNGRMRSNNNDGGLWVAADRFVGGLNTSQIGFFNNNSWRLVVSADGNVGIGTTSPATSLHVKGTLTADKLAITGTASNANGGSVVIGSTEGSNSNLRLGFDTDYSWLQSHGAKPLAINPLGNNVGIGTTNPRERLHVNGPVMISNVASIAAARETLNKMGTATTPALIIAGAYGGTLWFFWKVGDVVYHLDLPGHSGDGG